MFAAGKDINEYCGYSLTFHGYGNATATLVSLDGEVEVVVVCSESEVERCPIFGALPLEVLAIGCTMHISLKEEQSIISLQELNESRTGDAVYALAKRPCRLLVCLDTSQQINSLEFSL